MAMQSFLPAVTSDYLIVATVCGGTELKIIAFNYNP